MFVKGERERERSNRVWFKIGRCRCQNLMIMDIKEGMRERRRSIWENQYKMWLLWTLRVDLPPDLCISKRSSSKDPALGVHSWKIQQDWLFCCRVGIQLPSIRLPFYGSTSTQTEISASSGLDVPILSSKFSLLKIRRGRLETSISSEYIN